MSRRANTSPEREDIIRIMEEGTAKERAVLLLSHYANENIHYSHNIAFDRYDVIGLKTSKKRKAIPEQKPFLTPEEIKELISSFETTKDKRTYSTMRNINKNFLFFAGSFTQELTQLFAVSNSIWRVFSNQIASIHTCRLLEEMIKISPEKKEEIINYVFMYNQAYGSYSIDLATDGFSIDKTKYYRDLAPLMSKAVELSKSCKEYITMFTKITSKDLPLPPYRSWNKYQEEDLKGIITFIRYLTVDLDNPSPSDYPILLSYEDIEAIITDEDVEDFKSSGI